MLERTVVSVVLESAGSIRMAILSSHVGGHRRIKALCYGILGFLFHPVDL